MGDNGEESLALANETAALVGPTCHGHRGDQVTDSSGQRRRSDVPAACRVPAAIRAPASQSPIEGRLFTWGTSRETVAYPGPVPVAVAGFENVEQRSGSQGRTLRGGRWSPLLLGARGVWRRARAGRATPHEPARDPDKGEAPAQQVVSTTESTCVRMSDGTIECCGGDSSDSSERAKPTRDPAKSPLSTKATAFSGHAVRVAPATPQHVRSSRAEPCSAGAATVR